MNTAEHRKTWLPSGALALLALSASVAFAADRLEDGKWESAITADGMTKSLTYCITAAEAASINGDSKTGREFAEQKAKKAKAPCAFKEYEINGRTVSYTMTCDSRLITDKTVYRGQTSEGVKTITKEGVTVEMLIKSRRIGACP